MSQEARPPREARKIVTVVFSDVAESTRLGGELDPEATRRVMSRYFDTAKEALERHGGSVEKFIGDAVMAVFGIPAVHEDDALRAVRAVAELRQEIEALNAELEKEQGVRIRLRTGVNTGEVVAGDPAEAQMLVTGDAVNVAARLEQAAAPGEILIGEATRRLVSDAVRVEEVGALELRGKEDGVFSWRLLEVFEEAPAFERRLDTPLVGREGEVAQMRQAFDRAVEQRLPYLFTVLGPAGIGKSRLAAELAADLADRAEVLTGRCLPYWDGITFWPLYEIVAELAGESDDPRPAIARAVGDAETAPLVAERVATAVGRSEGPASTEETFWAVRKLFEALARERPLVLVLEDIHWAEPTFLDLVDNVADWSRDAPVFLLCLARQDLLEKRPAWGGGKLNATTILLRPLSDTEASALIDALTGKAGLSPAARGRIAAAAEGNPLFVEQMLAMVEERGGADGELEVPPTIQALLAARLDRLGAEEREVLERSSVIGRRFWAGAVAELCAGPRPALGETLALLVRKELVEPDQSMVPGEEGYRFRHQLIRDAAYAGIPKEVRAELHERFVGWIEKRAGERFVEVEEILGYHLEQAFRYRSELGPVDEHGLGLAQRAGERLTSAGRRASARGDAVAAASLLGRAASLLPGDASGREDVLAELGASLVLAGEFQRADAALAEAMQAGAAAGNRRTELHAQLERAFLRALTDPGSGDELRQVTEEVIPQLEELRDDLGLAKAWRRVADVCWLTNQWSEQERALQRSLEHAQRAGDAREAAGALMRLPMAFYYGPTPVPDAVRRADEVRERAAGARVAQSTALVCLSGLHAMSGRFDEARRSYVEGRAIADELGFRVWLAGFSLVASDIEMLAGDPSAAEAELRRGYQALEGMGERGLLSRVAAALARALQAQGQEGEAERFTGVSESLGGADVAGQISWRSVRAVLLARKGQPEAAEGLAREAVGLAEGTDDVNRQGRVLVDLAEVLERAGRTEEAVPVVEQALGCFEAKGNTVAAEQARMLLGRLRS
jgi:class 3 adenylate cyclase/tetratricopeptide (TPR) repeat protein